MASEFVQPVADHSTGAGQAPSPDSGPDLARRCAQEMDRYQHRQDYDPRPCYEMFRRALVHGDEQAWTALYHQYQRLVRRWLGSAPGEPDVLVNQVFERFWRALPPNRFANFSSLESLLTYLKHCAQSVAIDTSRQEERERVKEQALARMQEFVNRPGPDSPAGRILNAIVGEQVYERALQCLDNSQERLVFRASFEWNLKPADIAGRWPDLFATVHDVSRIKERILRRLQRDRGLRSLLEIEDEDGGKT